MKIKTDGKELLESETFLALDRGETVVAIRDGEEELSFILDFVQNEGKKAGIKW